MDFDYYQIRGKWNAATLNRRAEKLEEAQAAADELEEAGAAGVEIIGVKAGKRETIRGKKKAPKSAKTSKAKKVPAKKKKVVKRKKTAVKMTGTTGTYTTDYKTEKKAKAAAQNIRKLGYKTEIIEPTGQLDLFSSVETPKYKTIELNQNEIKAINYCLGTNEVFYSALPIIQRKQFDELETTIEKSLNTTQKVKFQFKDNELRTIALALTKEKFKGNNAKFPVLFLRNLIEFFKKSFSK
jgi:hypothetical protein